MTRVRMSDRMKFELDAATEEHGPDIVLDILTTAIVSTMNIGWARWAHDDVVESVFEDIREKLQLIYESSETDESIN